MDQRQRGKGLPDRSRTLSAKHNATVIRASGCKSKVVSVVGDQNSALIDGVL